MAAENLKATLEDVLAQTLEDAAFLFVEPTDPALPGSGGFIEARLAYSGDHDGELLLAVEESLASTLAANLLGEDEGGASATGDDEDAVGEVLNMIVGSFVVALFGEETGCRLGLPRVKRIDAPQYARSLERADAAATMMEEQGRRIDLSVKITRNGKAK